VKRSSAPADLPTRPTTRSAAMWGGVGRPQRADPRHVECVADRRIQRGPWAPTGVTSGAAQDRPASGALTYAQSDFI
jgi:hypothetical protein